ncbi:5-formyltetrahydrofolate cyclo-ligase [Cellulomonas sp. NPDC089187]|uniref:5-formyltetrahydrofolate cyclo-ligase n=1 Tax=Cellulomonas sp. NPDC089187 TaxID=3154970 RepID=UPI00343A9D42
MCAAAQPYPPASDGGDVTDTKDEFRALLRSARQHTSARQRAQAAAALAEVVATLPGLDQARCVAAYSARPSEPDTTAVLEMLSARGIEVLLPVLGAGLSREWATYAGPDDLVQRAPGRPPEPGTPSLGAEGLSRADLILAPALAVDSSGTRLGQGGGWYDRALHHARPGVPVVALVFPEEVYDAQQRPLPREEHDRPVDMIATPDGWQPVSR